MVVSGMVVLITVESIGRKTRIGALSSHRISAVIASSTQRFVARAGALFDCGSIFRPTKVLLA